MNIQLLFLGNAGLTEWLVIAAAVLLFFGGKKIPELMRGLGKGIREFNDAKNSVKLEMEQGLNEQQRNNPKMVNNGGEEMPNQPQKSSNTETTKS